MKQNTQSCLTYVLTISYYAHFNTSKVLFTFLSRDQSVRQSAMISTGLHCILCSATISNEMCTRVCL
jgi:cytochrome c-type biogenesis protein CcmH/NrfF